MFYYDYLKISDAIKELNDMVNNAFVGVNEHPKGTPTINVGEYFGAPKSFVGGKKEVDMGGVGEVINRPGACPFTDKQKIFLEALIQGSINSHTKDVGKDIHELYDRLGALSSNMNNVNEKVQMLKEDNLRLEGLVIELRSKTNMLEKRTGTIEGATAGNLKRISDLEEKHR